MCSRTCNVLDEECIPADQGGMTHIIVSGYPLPLCRRCRQLAEHERQAAHQRGPCLLWPAVLKRA